jgi:hypothetical protein
MMNKYITGANAMFWGGVVAWLLLGFAVAQENQKITVKYISAENVYLTAGSAAGLAVGDTLAVLDKGKAVGTILVNYVAEYSASCSVINTSKNIRVGMAVKRIGRQKTVDEVVSEAVDSAGVATPEPASQPRKQSRRTSTQRRSAKLSGSISLQYFAIDDQTERNLDFSQPTFRINLRARRLWGGDYTFRLKTRSRNDVRAREIREDVPQQEWRNRIYLFSFEFADRDARFNYALGRITSNRLSGVGYLDGLQLQYNLSGRFAVGVLGGNEPNWRTSRPESQIQKVAGFLHYHAGPHFSPTFESTVALAGAYASGAVSREHLYVRNYYRNRSGFSFFQSAEIDINRKWRKEKADNSVTFSNMYVSVNKRFTPDFSAGLIYDNRQNYWRYEIRSLADSLFDDALRTGLRANISAGLPGKITLFVNGGIRKNNRDQQTTTSYALSLSRNQLPGNLALRLSASGFSNAATNGYHLNADVSKGFRQGHRLSLGYYQYAYQFDDTGITSQTGSWIGQMFLLLPAQLYLNGMVQYDSGDDVKGIRYYFEMGYRL